VFAIVIGWGLLPLLLRAQSDDTLRVARLYLLGVPLLTVALVAPGVLRSAGDFVGWNRWRIAPGLLWTLVVVAAVVASRESASFLLYSHLALLAVMTVPMLAVCFRRTSGPVRPQREELRMLTAFGLPTAGQAIPQLLNLRLDQFLISATLSSTKLGLYAAAVNWCIGITLVMDACGFVLFPSLASMADRDQQLRRFAQSARLGLAVAIALALATAALTPLLFTVLFGESFSDGIPSALVLAAANGALGYARVLADGVRGLGEPSIALVAEVSGLVVMAIALAVLLPAFGIVGAALGSLLGYTAIASAIIVQVHRRFGLRPSHILRVRPTELIRALNALRTRGA
jgi:O-antigen/teichoic acid export membrane protein